MWRFILISFAFMGWSFYELSGGSDYVPGQNSFQARAIEGDARPADVEVARLDDQGVPQTDNAVVTRSVASLADLDLADGNRVQITLASVDGSNDYDSTVAASIATAIEQAQQDDPQQPQTVSDASVPESVLTGFVGEEVFSLETYVQRQTGEAATTLGAVEQGATRASGDIREVAGSSVNMRTGPGTEFEKVGKLSKGTQIAVLEEPGNGWVMLKVLNTGEIGWMADWLVTASN